MPRRCGVCSHPKREEIDKLLVARARPSRSFTKYGVSLMAVYRHYCEHLPTELAQAQGAKDAARADDLLGRLLELVDETREVLAAAKAEKSHALVLQAIARAEKQIELQARLAGELRDAPTVNVFVSAEWRAAESAILAALQPHPAIRVKVADALARLTAGNN